MTVDKFTQLTPELHRYAVEHSSFREGTVPDVEAAGEAMGDLALMQIAGDQAAFMTILVRATGARRALEVGTFLGYGAIAIARGLPEDGDDAAITRAIIAMAHSLRLKVVAEGVELAEQAGKLGKESARHLSTSTA